MTRFALPIAIIIALICGSVHFPTLAAPVAVSPLPSDPALESEVAVPSCVPPLGQGLQPVGGVQRSTFNAREPATAATNTVELNDKRNPHTTEVNFASLGTDGGVGTHNDGRGLSIFTLEPQMNAQAALERRELRRQKLRRRNPEQQKLIQQNTADAQMYEDRARLMKRLVDALEECINILEQHTLDDIEFLSFVETTSKIKFEAEHLRAEFQQRVASFTRHPPRTNPAQEDSQSCDDFSLHVSQKLEKAANSLYEWHAFEAGEPSSYVNHHSENSMDFEVEVDQLKYWISDFESRAKYLKDHVSEEIVHYRPVSQDVYDYGLSQYTR